MSKKGVFDDDIISKSDITRQVDDILIELGRISQENNDRDLQGVPQICFRFSFDNFLVDNPLINSILEIFQKPFPLAVQN